MTTERKSRNWPLSCGHMLLCLPLEALCTSSLWYMSVLCLCCVCVCWCVCMLCVLCVYVVCVHVCAHLQCQPEMLSPSQGCILLEHHNLAPSGKGFCSGWSLNFPVKTIFPGLLEGHRRRHKDARVTARDWVWFRGRNLPGLLRT